MSSFALQVGLAIAMVAAAVAAVVVLLRQSGARRQRGEPAPRSWEFGRDKHSVEAKAAEAAKLGENLLAAVKPIEFALKDLNKRVGELHARVDVSGKMLAKLTSPPRADEPSPEEKARAAVDAKLEGLEPRLKVLTDDLSTLKQTLEGITVREGAIADTVETSLVDVQGQIDALILRIERGERGRADLSLVASLASLKASSEQIAQRVAEMEQHFPAAPYLEARTRAVSIPVSVQPAEVAQDTAESAPLAPRDDAIAERADSGGDVLAASDAPASSHSERAPAEVDAAESIPLAPSDEAIAEHADSGGDLQDATVGSSSSHSEPAPWVLRQKERGRLRRRCLVCGQTKLLHPNERVCDDCEPLSEAERSRRRSFRKPKVSAATTSDDLRPRGKRK